MTAGQKDAGFTLLETLVALTLMAMVFAALAGFAAVAARSYESARATAKVAPWEPGAAVTQNMLRRARDLSGSATEMFFVSEMPQALEGPGLYFIRLRGGQDGGLQLASRARQSGPITEAEGNFNALTLIGSGVDVRFRYHDGQTWQESWSPQEGEPELIELAVVPRDPARPDRYLVRPYFAQGGQ